MDADFDLNGNDILNVDNIDVSNLILNGVPIEIGNVDLNPDSLVPAGGTDGQVLTKQSATDYDTAWEDVPEGIPAGGLDGQVLTKQSGTSFDADWESLPADIPPTIINVDSRTTLKALDTTVYQAAILDETTRSGTFVWRTGNFATLITADPREGIYIKADAIASTVGAWVRVFTGAVSAKWWGAVADGTTDDALPLNDAMQFDAPFFLDGIFATSTAVTYTGSSSKHVYGKGNAASRIILTAAGIDGFVKDGTGSLILQHLGITTNIDKSAGAMVNLKGSGSRDLIENCMIHGASGAVAGYIGILAATELIPTIRSNYILSHKIRAIDLRNAGVGGEAIIYGNTINTAVSSPTNMIAIYWSSGAGTLIVSHNRIQTYGYGILYQPVDGETTAGLIVSNNSFENTISASIALSLSASGTALMQDVNVSGNKFNNPNGGAAFRTDGATNTDWIDTITFTGNTVRFGAHYPVDIQAGAYFSESGNLYYQIGSNFGAIRTAAAMPLGGVCSSPRDAFIGSGIIPWTFAGNPNIRSPQNVVPVYKTANFTVTADSDYYINNKSGSSCTVTLPSATAYPGRELTFRNIQAQTVISASSNVTPRIHAAAGTAILASGNGNWCKMSSDGTNWVIMSGALAAS
jgi:hypothetical protein